MRGALNRQAGFTVSIHAPGAGNLCRAAQTLAVLGKGVPQASPQPGFSERESIFFALLKKMCDSSLMFHRGSLIGFLAADGVLLIIHAAFGLLTMQGIVEVWPKFFNIDRDWGGGEILSYTKWVLIIGALIACYMNSRKPIFLGLVGLFLVCLLDDSIGLHERGTSWLIDDLSIYRYFGTHQAMVGELMSWAFLGIPAAASLGTGWWMSNSRDRRLVLPALLFFSGVVVCAVGIDAVHSSLPDRSMAAGLVGMLEEGGEMIFLSLLLAFVWGLLRRVEGLQEGAA